MRKILEAVSLAALGVMFWIAWSAVHGPGRLPDRIPTHFNLAGQPDGWGSPAALLFLPILSAAVYLLMTVVARFPSAFNYPVRVTQENRRRLETLALDMIAWLKTELVCLFAWIEWTAIRAARNPGQGISLFLMPVILVAVFATMISSIVAMFRAGSSTLRP